MQCVGKRESGDVEEEKKKRGNWANEDYLCLLRLPWSLKFPVRVGKCSRQEQLMAAKREGALRAWSLSAPSTLTSPYQVVDASSPQNSSAGIALACNQYSHSSSIRHSGGYS